MKKFDFSIIIICTLLILFTIVLPFLWAERLGQTYSLVINPIIWIVITIITSFFYTDNKRVKRKDKKNIIQTVLIITLCYVIIYYMLGLFFGFLKTPFSHTLTAIFKNLISIVLIIILQEYVRMFLISKFKIDVKHLLLITLLFTIINIDWTSFFNNLLDFSILFKYISSTILPLFIINLLITYLALNSNNISGTIYRTIPKIFLIIFPIIPDIDWYFSSVLEIIFAFFTYIVINQYVLSSKRVSKIKLNNNNPLKTIPLVILIIIFVCFVAKVFDFFPLAIASNSMNPEFYRGDIAIIKKVNSNELDDIKVNDIIQYKLNNHYIVHRVIEVLDFENHVYKTKGDNNNIADLNYVYPEQIVGKVIISIPKLGYPSIWLSELFNIMPLESTKN